MFSACDVSNLLSCEFENTPAEPLSRCITAAGAGRTDRVFWQGVLSGGGASTSTTAAGRTRRDQKQAAFGCKLHFQQAEKREGTGNELCARGKNIRSKMDGTISIGSPRWRLSLGGGKLVHERRHVQHLNEQILGGECSWRDGWNLFFFFTHKRCMRERERGRGRGEISRTCSAHDAMTPRLCTRASFIATYHT